MMGGDVLLVIMLSASGVLFNAALFYANRRDRAALAHYQVPPANDPRWVYLSRWNGWTLGPYQVTTRDVRIGGVKIKGIDDCAAKSLAKKIGRVHRLQVRAAEALAALHQESEERAALAKANEWRESEAQR